jgi:tetratricopeptide (TPR) repeat protein
MSEISRENQLVQTEASFINFLKQQKYILLIISGIYIGIYFLLTYLYPYPNGLFDAGQYVNAAVNNKVDIYWPFGYSRFLIFLHVFSSSISFVVIVQFVLNALSSVFFILTIKYFFRSNNKYLDYIYYFFSIFSVLVLYLTDSLMSDSLFASLTLIWIALAIWFTYQNLTSNNTISIILFILHIIVLIFLISVRWVGLFYPVFTVLLIFNLKFNKLKYKIALSLIPILVAFIYYFQQKKEIEKRTGIEIFAPSSGCQMANNALTILPYIELETSKIQDKEVREFAEFAVKYDPLIESESPFKPFAFIWLDEYPLLQFLNYKMKQNHNSSFEKTWVYLSKNVYGKFGTYILIHYPFSYLRYYLIPNLINTLYPQDQFAHDWYLWVSKKLLKDWFHLDKPVYSNSDIIKNNSKFLRIYRLIIWVLLFSIIFYSFIKREKLRLKIFQVKIFWFILIFILSYLAFIVYSAPCFLRYLIPIHVLQITIIYILLITLFQASDIRDEKSDSSRLFGFTGKIVTGFLIFSGVLIIATKINIGIQSPVIVSEKWNQVCFKASGDKKRIWNDIQGALNDYLTSIEMDPNYAEAYLGSGGIYFTMRNFYKSIEEYDKAIEINPKLAEAYLKRAASYAALNNFIKSMEDLNKAIELAPDYSEALIKRGSLKVKMSDINGAFEDFNKAIALNPDYEDAYLGRGKLKFSLNDNNGAIEDFDKAISLNHQLKKAYVSRSLAKAKMNNYNGAIEDADQAIDIDPEIAEGYYNRGVLKEYMKDYKGAMQDLDKAIFLDARIDMAFYYRGLTKSNMLDNKGAIEDLNNAISLNSNNAKAIFLRGNIYFSLQNTASACIDWNSALKLGFTDAQDKIEKYCK